MVLVANLGNPSFWITLTRSKVKEPVRLKSWTTTVTDQALRCKIRVKAVDVVRSSPTPASIQTMLTKVDQATLY